MSARRKSLAVLVIDAHERLIDRENDQAMELEARVWAEIVAVAYREDRRSWFAAADAGDELIELRAFKGSVKSALRNNGWGGLEKDSYVIEAVETCARESVERSKELVNKLIGEKFEATPPAKPKRKRTKREEYKLPVGGAADFAETELDPLFSTPQVVSKEEA